MTALISARCVKAWGKLPKSRRASARVPLLVQSGSSLTAHATHPARHATYLSAMDPRTSFYFYFADEAMAQRAATDLRGKGFEVEVRLGADDENWLALAQKTVSSDDLDELEDAFKELGEELGGEYDGFDRPVG